MQRSNEADYVLKHVEDRGIRFVRLWFTDVLGFLKSITITSQELRGRARATGSASTARRSRASAGSRSPTWSRVPDPSTFQTDPLEGRAGRRPHVLRHRTSPTATPSTATRAFVLKRQLAARRRPRLHVLRRPRARVLLLHDQRRPEFLDRGGYFDETPLDVATDFRKRTVTYLEAMGIPVEAVHHEVAPSPARDRPPLHRRAHHGRLRHGVSAHREGGRAGVRRLRDVHAEAGRRRERQRDAHAPVAVRGRSQRVLRPDRRVPPVEDRPRVHRRASCGTRGRSRWSRTSG